MKTLAPSWNPFTVWHQWTKHRRSSHFLPLIVSAGGVVVARRRLWVRFPPRCSFLPLLSTLIDGKGLYSYCCR